MRTQAKRKSEDMDISQLTEQDHKTNCNLLATNYRMSQEQRDLLLDLVNRYQAFHGTVR